MYDLVLRSHAKMVESASIMATPTTVNVAPYGMEPTVRLTTILAWLIRIPGIHKIRLAIKEYAFILKTFNTRAIVRLNTRENFVRRRFHA